jgi:uroporphyrinogen decarboxylase
MDPLALKQKFGDKLVLHGGLNAAIWENFDLFSAEMRKYIPVLKQNGGYICSSDHSVPDAVSLETYKKTVALAKELGKYD